MWLAVGTLIAAMPAMEAAEVRYLGRAIVAVLEERRSEGIGLIYTSQLVPNTLRVLREPGARAGPAIIVEILAISS